LVFDPERFIDARTTRTNNRYRLSGPMLVVGDLMHEAGGQSFRFRKDLSLPNQVCLFRRRLYNGLTTGLQRRLRREPDRGCSRKNPSTQAGA